MSVPLGVATYVCLTVRAVIAMIAEDILWFAIIADDVQNVVTTVGNSRLKFGW